MSRLLYLGMILISLWRQAAGQLGDAGQEGWIDPGDMFNYDTGSQRMINKELPETAESDKTCGACSFEDYISLEEHKNVEDQLATCMREKSENKPDEQECFDSKMANEGIFFRQYTQTLVSNFAYEGSYQIQITLDANDMMVLKKYAGSQGGRVEEAHKVLIDMIDHVRLLDNPLGLSVVDRIENALGIDLQSLLMIFGILMAGSITLSVILRVNVPWPQLLWKLSLSLFVLSIPWNWWYLYKVAVANRQAELLKDMPAACKPNEQSASQSLYQWIASAFTFSSDECAKYHEKMLVDPIWEVPPTQALAVTITKFFLEPVQHIGVAIKLMIKGLLQDLPLHMWPIVIPLFMFLTVFGLILLCGYRVNFFWNIFRLEPARRPQSIPQPLPPPTHNMIADGAVAGPQQNTPAALLAVHPTGDGETRIPPVQDLLPAAEPLQQPGERDTLDGPADVPVIAAQGGQDTGPIEGVPNDPNSAQADGESRDSSPAGSQPIRPTIDTLVRQETMTEQHEVSLPQEEIHLVQDEPLLEDPLPAPIPEVGVGNDEIEEDNEYVVVPATRIEPVDSVGTITDPDALPSQYQADISLPPPIEEVGEGLSTRNAYVDTALI